MKIAGCVHDELLSSVIIIRINRNERKEDYFAPP